MTSEEIIEHTKRIIKHVIDCPDKTSNYKGVLAQALEFLHRYAGPKSSFFTMAQGCGGSPGFAKESLISVLESFIRYIESGLAEGISPERKAQLDVVSDFLSQAQLLLESKSVHPAAPAVLIGATLEEFLRAWIENEGLTLKNNTPSIDAYCKTLRESDLIDKQDIKDITAWAGIRNHAAHGEWDIVSDRQRICLMLEGVNLFIRKNTK